MNRFMFDLAVFIKERQQVNWEEIRAHFECDDDTLRPHMIVLIECGFIKDISVLTIPGSYPLFEYVPLQKEAK